MCGKGAFIFMGIRSRLLPQAIVSHSSMCSPQLALVLCFDRTDQTLSQPAHRKHRAIRINQNHTIKCKHTCTDIEIQNFIKNEEGALLDNVTRNIAPLLYDNHKTKEKNSRILYHLYHPTVQLINTIYKSKRE